MIGALAYLHSGLLDVLMSQCIGGPPIAARNGGNNTEELEMNLLSAQYLDQFLVELTQFSNEWTNRLKKVTSYELHLTAEALSERNEPVDSRDLQEFESNLEVDQVPSSLRDVMRPSKKYFAIVGPDLTNLTKLKNV